MPVLASAPLTVPELSTPTSPPHVPVLPLDTSIWSVPAEVTNVPVSLPVNLAPLRMNVPLPVLTNCRPLPTKPPPNVLLPLLTLNSTSVKLPANSIVPASVAENAASSNLSNVSDEVVIR